MKDEWKAFIDKLKIPVEFLHRDEFLRKLKSHPHNMMNANPIPAVFLAKGGKISLFITQNEINECKTLKDLMNLIPKKLVSVHP
ncbi:MAG: hypothetical protein OEZ21_07230 [Candidatus Bathyarchaeota archaeon]|nr:hypothetical protein [Candidatus Bathyarchaeota archaeon]MDH5746729.1 hypothetical protein [Candidatus Bathyarchaeota archaeon]